VEDVAMTSEQMRAARMMLRWEQKDLAAMSGVSLPTIKRIETKPGTLSAALETIAAIRKAFEDQGIEFVNGDAPGVVRKGGKAAAGKGTGPRRASGKKAAQRKR
jgi:transcriptional regulator with XRE-family HTH domain